MKNLSLLVFVLALAACQSPPPQLGGGRLKAATVFQEVSLALGPGVRAATSRPLNFAQMFLLQEVLARQTWMKLGPKESTYGAEWSIRFQPEVGKSVSILVFRLGSAISLMTGASGDWYTCRLSEEDSKRFLDVVLIAEPQATLPVFGAGNEEPNQSLEPTTLLGTSAAEQPLVPSRVVAHL